jgi:MinD superfamily P-loop ATPase
MKVAVASGKGGTGKTTIATSLALSLMEGATGDSPGFPQTFVDCDVEGPNAHLFLAPRVERRQEVAIQIPHVDAARCTACGRCAEVCQYHAIAVLGKRTLVFPQLCHGCGSCALVCPEAAISEEPHAIGVLEAGMTPWGIEFAHGDLNTGEPMAAPVIRQLKRWAIPPGDALVIIDAPPGTSCPVVEAVRGSDYPLLVTEPTPFGLHDLRLAVAVAQELGIPAGVIINRDGIGDGAVEEFCEQAGLPVMLRIPYERVIAEGIALGRTLIEIQPGYAVSFRAVYGQIVRQVSEHGIARRSGFDGMFRGGPA